MEYNDEMMPSPEIVSTMASKFEEQSQCVNICEMSELRQLSEIEEIVKLISYCEQFFKWLEGKDVDFKELDNLLKQAQSDKISTQSCCRQYKLDYRYACPSDFDVCKDFNKNCKNYCCCELEIMDRVIKLLTLRNSIIDKECMMKLMKNRMDAFKLIFNKYSQ